jgi:hypothetical protein
MVSTYPTRLKAWLRSTAVAALAGCSSPMPPYVPSTPVAPAPPGVGAPSAPAAPAPAAAAVPGWPVLGEPQEMRTWEAFRRQAAERMVAAATAKGAYLGTVPETLLAIPVLEIELNRDGSVRRIDVLRHPKQARDTTQIAIDAVRRAAPFGSVARLPRPWKFTETFLFDDERRFKPRTLD